MPTKAEIAWAAGLFEGEGCFSVRSVDYPYPTAQLTTTDEDVAVRFASIVDVRGSMLSRQDPRKKTYKPQFRWTIAGVDGMCQLRDKFDGWLGERRQARLNEVIRLAKEAGIGSRPVEKSLAVELFGKRWKDLSEEERREHARERQRRCG